MKHESMLHQPYRVMPDLEGRLCEYFRERWKRMGLRHDPDRVRPVDKERAGVLLEVSSGPP